MQWNLWFCRPWQHWETETDHSHPAVHTYDRIFSAISTLSIPPHRCSRTRSRFPSFFTPSAFPHPTVLAYDRIFSLSQHSHTLLFNHTNAFSLLPLSCAIPHAAVLAYDHIFTAIALSPHSHTPLLTRTNTFSLSRGILTRSCSRRELHFHCFFAFIPFSHSAILWVFFCYVLEPRRVRY